MRALALAFALLMLGCASSKVEMVDARGEDVTLELAFGGRGCIAVKTSGNGDIDFILDQAGESNWGPVRQLPLIVHTAIAGVVGPRGDTPPEADGPSGFSGCGGLFDVQEEIEPEPEVTVQAPAVVRVE